MFEFGWCLYPSLQHSTSQSVDSWQSTATYSTWLPPHFDLTFKVKALLVLNLRMFWSKTSKTIIEMQSIFVYCCAFYTHRALEEVADFGKYRNLQIVWLNGNKVEFYHYHTFYFMCVILWFYHRNKESKIKWCNCCYHWVMGGKLAIGCRLKLWKINEAVISG